MVAGRRRPRTQANALLRALLPGVPARASTTRRARAGKAVRAAPRPGTAIEGAARRAPAKARTPVPASGRGSWRLGSFRGEAGRRAYAVYVPAGLPRGRAVPLLVLLHGCAQSPEDLARSTRFNQLADRHQFLVVYPKQTAGGNAQRCWNWYEPAHQQRGAGEPAIMAGIVEQITADHSRWRVDPARVYVAGLSAGGAMALILGATYPDTFAAIGIHSAPPYRAAAGSGRALQVLMGGGSAAPAPGPLRPGWGMPPAVVFHGSADRTVFAVNGDRVVAQWLAFHAAASAGPDDAGRVARTRTVKGSSTDGRGYSVTRYYSARGRKLLEAWRVEGLGHAWSGGRKDEPFSDPRGPRASTEMWKFFAGQHL